MSKFIPLLTFFIFTINIQAQGNISYQESLNTAFGDRLQVNLFGQLDSLFGQISQGAISPSFIQEKNAALSTSVFLGYKELLFSDDTAYHIQQPQVVNVYAVSGNEYSITLAYIGTKAGITPRLRATIRLVATITTDNRVLFSLPLNTDTRNWKITKVGNLSYHHTGELNMRRAKLFNTNNSIIAKKFGLAAESFDFYVCPEYQSILRLLGYDFLEDANGTYRDGYGVDEHTIFSVMNNEDFSHDILHYYAAKIRTNPRNQAVEEGLAYYWGNGYYTDKAGEMVNQEALVNALKVYLQKNKDADLLALFYENPRLFNDYAEELSVKAVLSGVICKEIEQKKGIDGLKTLLNCGRGDAPFFQAINTVISINETNFNTEVRKLLLN
ncbi:hypothetical protein D3C71_825590 [compost metagenome]